MRRRMLGANEMTVRRRRSWTEKATSLPVVGFFTLRSIMGTKGTVVGSPEVERTLEPSCPDWRDAEEGVGVIVLIAELGDFV
jgi:hypothetical protein